MGSKFMTLAALLVATIGLVMIAEGGNAVTTVCGVDEDGQASCKPSIMGPSPTEPTSECCKALLGADLKCLCDYKSSPLLPALGIDPDLAIGAVKKCGITPPKDC